MIVPSKTWKIIVVLPEGNDDLKRINNTLNCAESPLIGVEKPVVSSYKTDDLPAIKTIENNLQPIKIISGIDNVPIFRF